MPWKSNILQIGLRSKRRMESRFIVLAAFLFFCWPVSYVRADQQQWSRYTNSRFGASAEVPRGIFVALPEPDNGSGLGFRSVDGRASMTIRGNWVSNTAPNFRSLMPILVEEARERGSIVTFKSSGNGWFAYSGYAKSRIFYHKVVTGCPNQTVANSMDIEYDVSARSFYDPIVARISKSMTSLSSAECP